MSKFLTECERIFGLTLFLRYNRRLYPTAAGHYVIDCAQKILDEKNRMLLTMKEVSGGAQERIRLATAPTAVPSSTAKSTTSSPAASRASLSA